MHLYLELYKITREINSIFGVEITTSIVCYTFWLTQIFYEITNIIFINDYVKGNNKILFTVSNLIWCFYFIFKFLYINYVCERISTKANITGDLINKISYSNRDINHENISQFLLQIAQTPLKFCGIGLFQFGYKVFHDFSKYTVTILVILTQMHMDK
ncbi:uncharacterized protein LOC112459639 [Temnothorax curvispinosus]|uniref:Uncharacterized protein LOC112459639 n=1 Tax=Temnothorax curvispinosus TaxID=300111 RepID=A0A6J1QE86_9HYME|nr:uncharacterized protein LOC112459639 [Temnothorax curvispinosus]